MEIMCNMQDEEEHLLLFCQLTLHLRIMKRASFHSMCSTFSVYFPLLLLYVWRKPQKSQLCGKSFTKIWKIMFYSIRNENNVFLTHFEGGGVDFWKVTFTISQPFISRVFFLLTFLLAFSVTLQQLHQHNFMLIFTLPLPLYIHIFNARSLFPRQVVAHKYVKWKMKLLFITRNYHAHVLQLIRDFLLHWKCEKNIKKYQQIIIMNIKHTKH